MNIRQITCEACCEAAVEYDNDDISVSSLDGKIFPCKSCSSLGRVFVDYEDNQGYARFITLKSKELSHVDFGIMVEAYEASQAKIDSLILENVRIENQLRNLQDKAGGVLSLSIERLHELEHQISQLRKIFEKQS